MPYRGAASRSHHRNMTESPESATERTTVTGEARAVEHEQYARVSRLSQALAWVGIIAGVVFVVAVVFFSGFFLGWSSGGHYGGHHGWHRGNYCGGPGGPTGSCSMMVALAMPPQSHIVCSP